MKKKFFETTVSGKDGVEAKINSALIGAKVRMEQCFHARKQGANQWMDVALLGLVGLILAVAFRDQIKGLLNTLIGKINNEVSAW